MRVTATTLQFCARDAGPDFQHQSAESTRLMSDSQTELRQSVEMQMLQMEALIAQTAQVQKLEAEIEAIRSK